MELLPSNNRIMKDLRYLLWSIGVSVPTSMRPIMSRVIPYLSINVRTTVRAMETISSLSPAKVQLVWPRPSVYLPSQPSSASFSSCEKYCPGMYASAAWIPTLAAVQTLSMGSGTVCTLCAIFCASASCSWSMSGLRDIFLKTVLPTCARVVSRVGDSLRSFSAIAIRAASSCPAPTTLCTACEARASLALRLLVPKHKS
mmetsp:Transcript_103490/g.178320  ORF Transcript_103490/g.178320 Transcript_103490/m.178320 type:complete len:200 (+) Transcript_103490:14225-14824(+)